MFEETELAVGLWDCPRDHVGLKSALLTKPDLLPDSNNGSGGVCTRSDFEDGWTDLLAHGGVWICTLFSSLCFLERRIWPGRSSYANVCLSPEGRAGPGEERTR